MFALDLMAHILQDNEAAEQARDLSMAEEEYLIYVLREQLQIHPPFSDRLMMATQAALIKNDDATARSVAEELLNPPCTCLQLPMNEMTTICLTHILSDFKQNPTCPMLEQVYLYYMSEKQLPTVDQFADMLRNDLLINHNPENYCEEKRLLVPTPNLDKLQSFQNEEKGLICSICQEPIQIGAAAFNLPCGDKFHASFCMGNDQSIITWLQKCKRCPNCNQEIHIH